MMMLVITVPTEWCGHVDYTVVWRLAPAYCTCNFDEESFFLFQSQFRFDAECDVPLTPQQKKVRAYQQCTPYALQHQLYVSCLDIALIGQ